MKKSYLFFLLIVMVNLMFAQTALQPAGSGTELDPYLIEELDNLYWVTQNPSSWDKYFKQTADIDASSTNGWDDGKGFLPIGDAMEDDGEFSGSYDGAGYTITGLFINRMNTSCIGFFAATNNADIKNISLINVDITGFEVVGGLAATSWYSTISNCYSAGSVIGTTVVGGLVGSTGYNSIVSSYSTGSVTGENFVGGLVGEILFSTVSNSYSTVSVSGSGNRVGGLVGTSFSSTFSNSYSTGSVIGSTNVGGLIGYDFEPSSTINNSFWDTQTSGQVSSAGGTGKTTAEMKTESTFTSAGWDFTNTWDMIGQNQEHYPMLQVFNKVELDNIGSSNFAVSGSKNIGFMAESGTIAVTFKYVNSAHEDIPPSGESIGVYWEISTVSGNTKVRLYYTTAQKSAFTGIPKIYHYTSGTWIELPTEPEVDVDGNNFYVETTNYYSSFSPVTVGDNASPLPVELTSFEGLAIEDGVLLNWETATEINNHGFEVERRVHSAESTEWDKIGFVNGHGNSNSIKNYNFTDNKVSNSSKYFYRLKQIDTDGKFEYSNEIEVDFNGLPSKFSLEQNYPNPFNPSTTITFSIPQQSNVSLKVYDALGSEVAELVNEEMKSGSYKINFDSSKLSSGIYFYTLRTNDFFNTRKMILIK